MKGRLHKLVLFALIGAIVNVAVAWGLAIRPIERAPGPGYFFETRQFYEHLGITRYLDLQTIVYNRPGEIQLSQREVTISSWPFGIFPQPSDEADFRALVPTWSQLAAGEPVAEVANHHRRSDHGRVEYTEYASGWPSYSMKYHGPIYVVHTGSKLAIDESSMTGYFHPKFPQKMVNGGYRSKLPFLPIWPGFAINTILYAAFLWLLTLGPFTVRRMIRRRRGLCITCGYDLRGDLPTGCPECGWRRGAPSRIPS